MGNGGNVPKFGGKSLPAGSPPPPKQQSGFGTDLNGRPLGGLTPKPRAAKPKPPKIPTVRVRTGTSNLTLGGRTIKTVPTYTTVPTTKGHDLPLGTRRVQVKAHTRTIKPKAAPAKAIPAAVTPAGAAPTPKPLPATHDKTPRVPAAAGANTPQPAASQPSAPDYSSLLLYPNQTPQQLATQLLAPQYTQIGAQQKADQAALTQFTQAMLAQLGQYPAQVGTDYQQASDRINSLGSQAAQMVAALNPNGQNQALLGAAGAPAAQQTQLAAQNANNFGGAAANLYAANGLLPAQTLETQKAAAMAYAHGIPQVQALAATQAAKNLLYQGDQARLKVGEQYPGLVNQFATAKSDAATKVAGLEQNAQALGYKTAQQSFDNQVTLQKLSLLQEKLNYQKAAKAAGLQAASGKIDVGASKLTGILMTAQGIPLTKNGKVIPISASGAAGAPKVPSAKDLSGLVDAWRNGKVQSVRVQATDKNGQPAFNPNTGAPVYISQSVQVGKIGYGQAYRRLLAMGLNDKQARGYLDTAYQRGTQGRAWVTNAEQQALLKAKLPPKAKVINGKGVLTPKQYQALKRAGFAPAGQLTQEGFYVLAPTF